MSHSVDFSNKTGFELLEYLKNQVDNRAYWVKGAKSFTVTGGPEDIEVRPNPTYVQSGNGVVFIGGEDYPWDDLIGTVKSSTFAAKYERFLDEPLKSSTLNENEFAACVLLLFEIARRRDGDRYKGVSFLSRVQTEEAIKIALNNNSKEGVVDYLMNMFSAKWFGPEKNFVQLRRDAYTEIMKYDTSVDDVASLMTSLSTKSNEKQ